MLAEARPRVRGQFVRVKKDGEVETTSEGKLADGDDNAEVTGKAGGAAASRDTKRNVLSAGDRDQPPPGNAEEEEAMEYDCREEDMSTGGDEPSAGEPADAEIGCGVAVMLVEPAPTMDGPSGSGGGGGGGAAANARRLTRSQAAHVVGGAHHHITGHKHRRQVVRRESTPGPTLQENTSADQTKTMNGGSDSGSNSPQEELSLSEIPTLPPPAKQQHR